MRLNYVCSNDKYIIYTCIYVYVCTGLYKALRKSSYRSSVKRITLIVYNFMLRSNYNEVCSKCVQKSYLEVALDFFVTL